MEFSVFDTETTGLEPQSGDRVIEIACARYKGREKIAEFSSLVDPGREVSPAAFAVNKISSQMLKGAPATQKVIPEFLGFIKGSCLCSYNAAFDLGFLNNELRLLGLAALEDVPVIDVLKMARRMLPGLERYALWFVAERLGVKRKQEHRALSDVNITWDVFSYFREMLGKKGILDYRSFLSLFSVSPRVLSDLNNQRIAEIQEAIGLKVALKIRYLATSNAEVTLWEVIPKEIRQERGQSYLVGFCKLRNEERSFRIDGILHLEII